MTQDGQKTASDRVSRSRYERERNARLEAEALLETKSSELFEANQKLLKEAEVVRTALAESQELREREAASVRDRSIQASAIAALSGHSSATEAMQALLICLKEQFGATEVIFFQAVGGGAKMSATASGASSSGPLPLASQKLSKSIYAETFMSIVEGAAQWDPAMLDEPALMAPIHLPNEAASAICLIGHRPKPPIQDDLNLLRTICELAVQPFAALKQARRNAMLVNLLEGTQHAGGYDGVLDEPLEAVHRAFDRLSKMQGQVSSLLDRLLAAPVEEADTAVEAALVRATKMVAADQVWLFSKDGPKSSRLRMTALDASGARVNSAESISDDFMLPWKAELAKGVPIPLEHDALARLLSHHDCPIRLSGHSRSLLVPMMQGQSVSGVLHFAWAETTPNLMAGETQLVQTVATGITSVLQRRDQSNALKELAASEAMSRATLSSAVETLQDGFVLYDRDDCLVVCNQRYREIYSRSAPAMIEGATFESILRYGLKHGEYEDAVGREDEWLEERLERHRQPTSEIEQRLSDGRWLRIFEKETEDGGRVGLRVDITAIKLAEFQAKSDRAAAMEASHDGFAITDRNGEFLYANDAYKALLGAKSATELIGSRWQDLVDIQAEQRLGRKVAGNLRSAGSWSGEMAVQLSGGGTIEVDLSLNANADESILWVVRDISERKKAAEELDTLREELQRAQGREIIGQLAAGLAHDFNNLLASISGNVELLRSDLAIDEPSRAGIDRILDASEQAKTLVKRLFELGARETATVRTDLRQHVEGAAELVQSSLRAPIFLETDLPDTPCMIDADPTDILQVVLNLGINARDAMKGQGGAVGIRLRQALPSDFEAGFEHCWGDTDAPGYLISVSDEGTGIPEELQDKILTPYFSTKGAEGTGLGLPIIVAIVTRYGGALRLSSGKDGTTFDVFLPAQKSEENEAQTAAEKEYSRDIDLSGLQILVVDDNPDMLDLVSNELADAGAEVAPSVEPQDVLEAVADDPDAWHMVVTDYEMPELSGAQLASRLRKLVPELPLVLVTGKADLTSGDKALFDAVLRKPTSPGDLANAIATILGERADEREV